MQAPIQYHKTDDGIVTLTFDAPEQSVNTMTDEMRQCLADMVSRLEAEKEAVSGVILTSAKETFFAGGNLNRLYKLQPADAATQFDASERAKSALRRLETLGKPVVAALNGTALGGGFEIALACHHRIALDKPKVQFGLPEATLGLMPGAGGVVRLNRLLGLAASQPYLQDSKLMSPAEATKVGLVHELADTPAALLEKARAWIAAHPESKQPWDKAGYTPPGGWADASEARRWISTAAAQVRAKTKGCYPAPEAILCASVEGMQVDFDTASRIETRYFVKLVTGQVAKNIISTFWFHANGIKSGAQRPAGVAKGKIKTVGVLGAGMMGKGIAYVAASRGIEVWVKDATLAQAEGARANADQLLAKREEKGEIDAATRRQIVERIHATDRYEDFAHVDLVVEAIPENPALKAEITRQAEPVLGDGAIWASNTSTLPITGLAKASSRPERFVGLHFFSPVHRMQLVEVIKGQQTSPETLAHALDFVMQLGKTPIVVNDNRGFFTSRVFSTFTREAVAMLGEGQDPAAIEAAAILSGFPAGPLAVLDEVSLSLNYNNRLETLRAHAEEGRPLPPHPADAVMERMLNEFGRKGRAAGGGFYDYPADGKKVFWSGLAKHFLRPAEQIPQRDKQDRLLFCMALESVRVLQDGVLDSAGDGNIGSVLGIGFPRWSGGVFQFLNQYGLEKAVARAEYLAEHYGERFTPPQLLREKAKRAEPF
ncbi:fatty acid oxidation complex subunit alpha (plasmid) [Cupriavidus necator N-1]|uniref:Fatty acid oxidation complex subunit alpha n=1 Tax=Cupriavidus necator (strain ATCC 43291 / DSM 13513 / CCUG 52238 / LMG 8453 / N-1) TaxID=1042878 RepID=F8GUD3_CUPNN|nr:3-hydroxyacyl-CoA dehydrogenase NAD-binding domain-containing protein [Cupriavidus necator]AEI82337.1 fatty acid oxidation complex subunit alpha [Cupriavidus necator N-1]MDX6007351.1 3-hydroxyacyl-CoA dehydrogenase NAD-binding domain-containing protein [Cupriavidus necator]